MFVLLKSERDSWNQKENEKYNELYVLSFPTFFPISFHFIINFFFRNKGSFILFLLFSFHSIAFKKFTPLSLGKIHYIMFRESTCFYIHLFLFKLHFIVNEICTNFFLMLFSCNSRFCFKSFNYFFYIQ